LADNTPATTVLPAKQDGPDAAAAGRGGSSGSGSGSGSGSDGKQPLAYPLLAQTTFGAFVAYALLSLLLPTPGELLPGLVLALLLSAMGLWFVLCVTGDAQTCLRDLYTFSYAFTLGAFVLLLMPLLSDRLPCMQCAEGKQPSARAEAALQLVRGCVRVDGAGGKALGAGLAPCPPSAASVAATGAGLAANLPAGSRVGDYRYSWLVSIGGVTARRLLPDDCATAKHEAQASLARADDTRMAAAKASDAASGAAPGSVLATSAASAATAAASAASAASVAQGRAEVACATGSGCASSGVCQLREPVLEVIGGLTVPLFVLVLALIGGAVSLSRRIPEYQRRNNMAYVPTDAEPFMPAFRVREAVVFQTMQLVSAPFLAIGSWHIIEPASVAAAATLAFATGFFSETVLLMIRGMVNGLRPEVTKVPGVASANLVGRVVSDDKEVAFDTLRVELRTRKAGEWRNVPVDAKGSFTINGVPVGRYDITVIGAALADGATKEVEVDDKQGNVVELKVKKK